jgi:hypothetical protein
MLAALCSLSPSGAAAQNPSGSPVPPYISFEEVTASPGATVMVPLYYTPGPQTSLRSFTIELQYVSNNLQFQDATGGIVDPDALRLTSSLSDGQPDDKGVKRSRLRISVSLADENAAQGLGEGLLAYLMFSLSPDAKPFVIKLNPTIISAEDTQKPARKVSNLTAQPGSVIVQSADVTPEMSCFFFTH